MDARKGRKKPATQAVVARRVEEVLRIRLDGAEFWDVREYAREKEKEKGSAWELKRGDKPLSEGQLWRYVGRADGMIAESCRASRKRLVRRHLAQRRNLYAKAVSAGDVRTALAVLDSEAKMLALFPTPEDELRREVAALTKMLAESNHGPGDPAGGSGQASCESASVDGGAPPARPAAVGGVGDKVPVGKN